MPPSTPCRTLLVSALVLVLAACSSSSGGGGDGNGGGPPAASGTLTVGNCSIAADASSCDASIAWSTTNASSPRVQLDAATLSTTASGSTTTALGAQTKTVTLFDGTTRLDEKTIAGGCVLASAWDGSRCQRFATRSTVRAATPFTENGRPVTLEVVLYTPLTPGPYPTVMFNHGSTGNGDDPSLFSVTFSNEPIAQFFAERGWLVAFPQRRGRGASDGTYDEGFTVDRARYSCEQSRAVPGFDRALLDLDAAIDYLRTRGDVDTTRLISAGTSRGGILAVAHASIRPTVYDAAINFVGGWLGEGCVDAVVVNRAGFARGTAALAGPTLWLYGTSDSFYSIAHSEQNHAAFRASGGVGGFNVYTRAPGLNGHFIVNDPALWTVDLDRFVRSLPP